MFVVFVVRNLLRTKKVFCDILFIQMKQKPESHIQQMMAK